MREDRARGLAWAMGAYLLWGALPVYWKMLKHVGALEVLAHRVLWSALFLTMLLAVQRRAAAILTVLRTGRTVGPIALASVLIAANWGIYIWAVNSGHVLETSLGYFINPLLNVVLGTIFLGDRLRPRQWVAVGLVTASVVYLVARVGRLPWIALALAVTFALYALCKKKIKVDSTIGLAVETWLLAPPSVLWLFLLARQGSGAFGHVSPATDGLLVGSGLATAAPLLCFAFAAKHLTLSVLGFCQYLAPTVQFLLAVFLYREPFTPAHLVTFLLLWSGIAVFVYDGWCHSTSGPKR